MRTTPLALVVDDEESFLEITSMKLRAAGFETELARGAFAALEMAENLQPDFVLSDIYMAPGPSGWDFALELHRNPKTRGIKLALFTSLRDPWLEVSPAKRQTVLQELGTVAVLSKVDDLAVLGDRVRSLLS
jgi:CheY-like chemotaxis protein